MHFNTANKLLQKIQLAQQHIRQELDMLPIHAPAAQQYIDAAIAQLDNAKVIVMDLWKAPR